MDLRLTVSRVGDDRTHDVTVTSYAGHTAADLLGGLLDCLGGSGTGLQCGGRPIAGEHPVGLPPLLDGASLTIGAPTDVPKRPPGPRAALVLDVVSGPDCGQTLALTSGRHTIGRDPDCTLVIADPAISRRHAEIVVSSDGVRVTDLGSTNPARVVGSVAAGSPLSPGDEFQLGDTRLCARAGVTRPLARTPAGDGTIVVHRSPHVPGAPVGARLELPRRPAPPAPHRVQWLALLLPIPVCGLLALLWGPQLLAFALLGPLVGGGSAIAERRAGRRRYAAELAVHTASSAAVRRSARRTLAADLAARHREHPDPAEVARAARDQSPRLWERRPSDPPVVRIGLGPVASRVVVVDPDRAESSAPEVLVDAPVTVDLSETSVFGVAGARGRLDALARCLLTQLAVLHSPDDLVVHVLGASATDDLSWTGWLPHAGAGSAPNPVSRQGNRTEAAGDNPAYPWTVTVILLTDSEDPSRLESLAAMRDAATDDRHVAIVLAESAESLPAECSAVLELGPDPARTVLSLPGHEPTRGLVIDGVSAAWAERVGRRLAPLRAAGRGTAALPTSVTFATTHPDLADRWSAAELATRWATPPPGLQSVLGVDADGPLVVDLDRDGPHALVGGTTGAGKSELLRALVTGFAACYPPEAVTFLLIDYKGGAAFRECARLPHTVGVVTDLDADLARRALVSLTAEIRRREALFAAVGASSLADHERLRGPADERLPRLVIVVDEFKMLIEERPEFVEGMVRLAAVGRSLGVHLVLATQRPAGAITADIQANVNLRIALRVRDRQDSEGVIAAPDAALLPESLPGRALLSTGAGRLVAFQTAHVGSSLRVAGAPLTVRLGLGPSPVPTTDPARLDGSATELGRFVDLARTTVERGSHRPPRRPWLPDMPPTLSLDDLLEPAGDGHPTAGLDGVPIGRLDLPEHQVQPVWTWSPGGPTTLGVVGAPGSGRSTLVRTLVAGLPGLGCPAHAYVIDGGGALGPLARLPWVGAVVAEADRVRVRRLLDRLRQEIRSRTSDLAERGLTTLGEWRLSAPSKAPPDLLLVVDGWESLAEPPGGVEADLDGLALAGDLRALIESGGAAGLRAVLTGGRGLLLGRGARLCAETVVLGRLDPTDAALAGLPGRDGGSQDPRPGRGIRLSDGAVLQVAHLGADPSGAAQSLALTERAHQARHAAARSMADPSPFTVGRLPDRVDVSDLPPGSPFVIGIDSDGTPCGFTPELDGRRLLVAGPRRSGRTSLLLTIAERSASAGYPVVLVSRHRPDGPGRVPDSAVGSTTASHAVTVIGPDDEDTLARLRRSHPGLVVLVDDADQLAGSRIEPALLEIISLLDRDGGVIVAAVEPHGLNRLIRGVAVEVASRRTGVLLCPTGRTDGDAFGVRVPRVGGAIRPGRGHLVARGVITDLQVAAPSTGLVAVA